MMSIITSEQPSTGSNNVNRNQAVLVNNNNENETCNAYNDQTCECKKHMMANMNHSSKMSCLKSQDSATAHSTTSPNDGSEPSTNTNNNTNTPSSSNTAGAQQKENVFTLKRWNLVAMWSWDVECEVCAICRTPLMGKTLYSTLYQARLSVYLF